MTATRSASALSAACVLLAAGLLFAVTASSAASSPEPSSRLVVHEWGTFTSFSGADGVNVGFTPDNTDLPDFVCYQENTDSKAARLRRDGSVSMETPVIYFYPDRETRASVKVDFPKGWVTEWYPYASGAPRNGSRGIRWDVRLLPGESFTFPRGKEDNAYYRARETDAAPVQVEVPAADPNRRDAAGRTTLQREKFLFYRGVGTFPTPVAVRAMGSGQVRVRNVGTERLSGVVLLNVRGGRLGFRPVPELAAGAEMIVSLPPAESDSFDLADLMVRNLTAAGLYEKEARAMVRTWDRAWFREEGARVLYLVPRAKTDELLPLAIDPKPTALERVLVGRHDFLTPEQEAALDRQVERSRAARAELDAAEKEIRGVGRFADAARRLAEKRLDGRAGRP